MRKPRSGEAQNAEILKEGESGVPVDDLIRQVLGNRVLEQLIEIQGKPPAAGSIESSTSP